MCAAKPHDVDVHATFHSEVFDMLTKSKTMMQSICFVAAAITATALVSQAEVSHRVKAILKNRESSLHTSVGNRDVYLLRVTPRSGAAFDAIVMDSYPGYAEALPLRSLAKDVTFSVKLIRTPYCDRSVNSDGQELAIRCFMVERDSLKMPKNAASDFWWK
jgi:hypothetical protein